MAHVQIISNVTKGLDRKGKSDCDVACCWLSHYRRSTFWTWHGSDVGPRSDLGATWECSYRGHIGHRGIHRRLCIHRGGGTLPGSSVSGNDPDSRLDPDCASSGTFLVRARTRIHSGRWARDVSLLSSGSPGDYLQRPSCTCLLHRGCDLLRTRTDIDSPRSSPYAGGRCRLHSRLPPSCLRWWIWGRCVYQGLWEVCSHVIHRLSGHVIPDAQRRLWCHQLRELQLWRHRF